MTLASRLACLLGAWLCAAPAQALVLGVTEGVTYRATDRDVALRFEPIAELLSKALRQPVRVEVVGSYGALREALRQRRLDIAFVHPAHVALDAVKRGQYGTAAWTAGFTEYKVTLLCRDGKAVTDWSQLAGRKLVTPDVDSITAVMARAQLREGRLAPGAVTLLTTRYQDAVPFYVENHFADYGATAAKAVLKAWVDKGGKTCGESRGVPIKQWLTSSALDAAGTATVRETLLTLAQTDAGRKALAASGYGGFIAPAQDSIAALTAWLGL